MAKRKIEVKRREITIVNHLSSDEYISLTDIARYKNADAPNDVIKNWLRNKNTIELLGLWEKLNNHSFKPVEFDGFRNEAELNHFVLSPKNIIRR
jgi:hypothetical protein